MSTNQFDPARAEELIRQAATWSPPAVKRASPPASFEDVAADLKAAMAALPEKVELPYHHTPEGERWAQFKKVCDERFHPKLDYALVKNRLAFDKVALWDGRFPGPCAAGATGLGKSTAAWWALRRLFVTEGRAFAWFPVRRLVTEMERYEKNDCADEFYRAYDHYRVLFIDDLDKINWDFESHGQMLFAFVDWAYRKQKPVIMTTNRDREWWAGKMGDAFVRRLFTDACFEVKF